ncbi:MAG TPA: PQQ-dependent sugar dehydrogenase [Vitreimonas sp.]|nr:PQQ-dependent sugar dehydrogenase [Vitreimonas sp.]
MSVLLSRGAGAIGAIVLLAACAGGATDPPSPDGPSPGRSVPATPTGPASPPAPTSTASGEPRPFDPAAVTITLEPVVEIPGAPLAIAAPDDGSGRLYVAERGGRIWTVGEGQRGDQPFLDIATRVTAGGEQGLLGLAFHPDFPEDPRLFIYYTDRNQDNVVAERRIDPADPERADGEYEREILRMDDFAPNHNGGALAFGPDGYLYIATGDGGGAGDPQQTGQRLDTLLGKILRIGVAPSDTPGDYQRPPDNPFTAEGGLPEIWHTGLRNPWRFSFDRETDDLWIGDVGQNRWEEINVDRGGAGGLNFGWSIMEGRECFREEGCDPAGLTAPVTVYPHDLGCSVTGGFVYRGQQWPALVNGYLFADYCSGRVWALDASSDEVGEPLVVAETNHAISSFGEDAGGELYATDLQGRLLRVVAPGR